MHPDTFESDAVIVGAGAAGLATAIFAVRQRPGLRVVVLDGARKIGAKILVSGGGRCNVTNRVVTAGDFFGGNRNIIRKVLAALPVEQTIDFFREIGVPLHEEEYGKLFPDSNDAHTVLGALLAEARRLGVDIRAGHRVTAVRKAAGWFEVCVSVRHPLPIADPGAPGLPIHPAAQSNWQFRAPAVVLATGGQSLPKTGSDGFGYELARSLGHSIVPTTPGLAPLVLEGDFHVPLSGVSQDVEIMVRADGMKPVRLRGPMLWTHFGISGPAAMNASRCWHRARQEGRAACVSVSFLPNDDFASAERRLIDLAAVQPKAHLVNAVATLVPARFAEAALRQLGLAAAVPMAHLSKEDRRRLVHALLEWTLPVRDSRGYNYAEVTAGGVPLEEVNPATMESRRCPGLYLVGEILDADGRIGGYNFQWAWCTGKVASQSLVALLYE